MLKHSLAHLQDLIPTLTGVIIYIFILAKVGIKSSRYARECIFAWYLRTCIQLATCLS